MSDSAVASPPKIVEETKDNLAADQSNPIDPRHLKRIKVMQAVFAADFREADAPLHEDESIHQQAREIYAQKDQIDQDLASYATERPLEEINKVDLAILRVIVFESLYKKTPKKVLIDEAVELAKEFGTDTSPKFVNGVLGKLLMGGANK